MARWKYRKSKRNWSRWSVPILVVGMIGVWCLTQPLHSPKEWVAIGQQFGTCGERGRPPGCVSDGDTVTLGYGSNARRIRLTGFDAPEIDGRCDAERAAARRAESALRRWLNAGPFEWDGGATPPRDKYGRELRSARRVRSGGSEELLADHMIGAKLASGDGPFEWREWCP